MLLALIPYLSISSAGLPLRGTSLTASRLILMSGYSLSPAATASPIPPGTKNVKGTLLIFFSSGNNKHLHEPLQICTN